MTMPRKAAAEEELGAIVRRIHVGTKDDKPQGERPDRQNKIREPDEDDDGGEA